MTSPSDNRLDNAFAVLDRAVAETAPIAVIALFSGGHDSLCSTHVANRWARERQWEAPFYVASIDTTTAIRKTLDFINETVSEQGWAHKWYTPPDSFEELVLDKSLSKNGRQVGGFPGPGFHNKPYNRLKERCIAQMVREAGGRKARVLLVSGCRSDESVRRMRHTEKIQYQGRRIWVAPLHDWSKPDCNQYIAENGLKRNIVSDLIHRSGECNCGSMANGRTELKEMLSWEETRECGEWILNLEQRAREAGIHACVWGTSPPNVDYEQQSLLENEEYRDTDFMLCTSCEARRVGRE